jgi:CheY-like chemotaxis protein
VEADRKLNNPGRKGGATAQFLRVSVWETVEFPIRIRARSLAFVDRTIAAGWCFPMLSTQWPEAPTLNPPPHREDPALAVNIRTAPSDSYLMHTFVLADDHGVVRQSLKRLLLRESDLHLLAESSNGLEVLEVVSQLQPELLITDLMMPGLNGLEVIRRVRLASPGTRIVAVSVNSDEPYVEGAFTCGADAYVLKASCGRHLVPAVRAVLGGSRYISPPLAGLL